MAVKTSRFSIYSFSFLSSIVVNKTHLNKQKGKQGPHFELNDLHKSVCLLLF